MKRSRIRSFLLVIFSFLLTACVDPSAGYPGYVVRYPSGAEIDTHGTGTGTKSSRRFRTDDRLEVMKMKRGEDTEYVDYVDVQDKEGNILYTLEMEINYAFYTGQMIDGRLWICGEEWSSPHGGRIDNYLDGGQLCGINLETKMLEYDHMLEKNEFFLTVRDEYAYFYHRGEKGVQYFGGLYEKKDQNARIYRRALSNWETIQTVYEFDYAEKPEDYFDRIVFELQEEKMAVIMADSGKMENGEWGYIPIHAVEFPYVCQ